MPQPAVLRRGLQDGHGAGIRQMAQPKFERIDLRGGGQFVHERLIGKGVRRAAQTAHGRRAQGQAGQPVRHDALILKVVIGGRVAIAPAEPLRAWPSPTRSAARPGVGAPTRRALTWDGVQTSYSQAITRPCRSSPPLHLHHHGRRIRLPREFVLARPLHAHRFADGTRQDGTASAAASSEPLCPYDPAPSTWMTCTCSAGTSRRSASAAAERKDALRVAPDHGPAGLHIGDGAGRADRGVRLKRLRSTWPGGAWRRV